MPRTLTLLATVTLTMTVVATQPVGAQPFDMAQADANGDGAISKAEATEARSRMFGRLDRDGDGQISETEIQRAQDSITAMSRMVTSMMYLRMRRMDTDGDGNLSQSEFMASNPMFERMDRNSDGIASADEIARLRARFAQSNQ